MTKLLVDFCSYHAAKYAVEHWHYSKTMPVGKIVKLGVWEDDKFIGAILFCHGNNQYQGNKYGLLMTEIVELSRVALTAHINEVSKIVSIAVKLLKSYNDKLRCLFSYADPEQLHNGGIYQAMNWVYVGRGGSGCAYYDKSGMRVHSRLVSATGVKEQFGNYTKSIKSSDVRMVKLSPKHKYIYPLDRAMRRQVSKLAQPYPKREHNMRAIEGNDLVSNETRRFDSDPSAIDTPERTSHA